MRAGDRLRHGGQRRIDLSLVSEAMLQHLHLHDLALVRSRENRTGRRQAVVGLRGQRCRRRRSLGRSIGTFYLGRIEAEVGVVGQFLGATASALGQTALDECLQLPSESFEQPNAIPGRRLVAEDLGVADAQLAGGQAWQGGEVGIKQGLLHVLFLSVDIGDR